jgi:acyl dehydratase
MNLDLTTRGKKIGPFKQDYNWRDVALYAIGLGAGTDDLKYVLDDPTPQVLPTFGVVPSFVPVFDALKLTGGNLVTLLHSGQRTELVRPIPACGTMETTAEIRGIWDMKVGALVLVVSETSVGGEVVARTEWQLLLRGEGGFKGERPPRLLRVKTPKDSVADFAVEVQTNKDQALLYRLNGDINPIHSKPEVAKEAGFDRPILHGLCTYGIAARIALKELCGDEPTRFKSFEARFAKVVMPGDTLLVQGWLLEEPGRAAVTVTVKESSEVAIANALLEFTP